MNPEDKLVSELVQIQLKYDELDSDIVALLAAILGAYFQQKEKELLEHILPWIEDRMEELMEAARELEESEKKYIM